MSKEERDLLKKSKAEIKKKSVKLKELVIEWIPFDKLKPNWYNPNRQSDHEFELLCRSMTEDGFTQPIVALKDGTIVDGEHRWRAAQTLGMKEVPVVVVDMSPEQMRISTLRHNRARGNEDLELVGKVLRELSDLGAVDWAQDSLMMDDVEVRHMMEEVKEMGTRVDVEVEFDKTTEDMNRDPEAFEKDEGKKLFVTRDAEGRELKASLSKDAADELRAKEKELQESRDKEHRQMVEESWDVATFSFIYTDKEALIVKTVLGKESADTVLSMCVEEFQKSEANVDSKTN